MINRPHTLQHKPIFRRLAGPITEVFDSGTAAQNEFLLNSAWQHQQNGYSVTDLVYVGGMLAGYVTTVMSELELDRTELPSDAPFSRIGALKLAQMAVDKRFAERGLGTMLIDLVILRGKRLSQSDLGCRYVILDALPEKVGYYERRGFVRNELTQKKREKRARTSDVPVSMRFDLREPGAERVAGSPTSLRARFVNAVTEIRRFVRDSFGRN